MSKNRLRIIILLDKFFSDGETLSIPNIQLKLKSCIKNEVEIKGIEERNIEYCISEMKNGIYGKKAPIENIRGVGYRYSVEGFSLFYKEFSENDRKVLSRAIEEIKGIGKNELAGSLSTILHRTSSKSKSYKNLLIDYEKPQIDSGLEYFDELYQHISEKNTITITYRPFGSDDIESKTVFPYLLKEYRNRWYLIAYDNSPHLDKIANLGLERIENVEINKNVTYKKCNENLLEYYIDVVGTTIYDVPTDIVRIKVSKIIADYIKTKPIHHSQKVISVDDENWIFEYQVKINLELRADILRFGSEIEILSPLSFRDEVRNELIKSISKYS